MVGGGVRLAWTVSAALLTPLSDGERGAETAAFEVQVGGKDDHCAFFISGRLVTINELAAAAAREAKFRRRVRVYVASETAPYRCIGAAVFTLQKAGLKSVETILQPSLD